ncbi:hypothetical protein SLEP1_g51719 [Rubroshorea leprosula]|uniref:DUF4219 domain-containing protein n=1 Tax=Rubroshorea leprosula TaxID=152421 RepID=A0AAV5M5M2_9ROSI|nr:hypothetical protein SLEP1_g51719 [Rubroshorea leprosula]
MSTSDPKTILLFNPPLFTGENYNIWAIKMKTFLKRQWYLGLNREWFNPPRLPNNPTVAQLKSHSEYVEKAYKALSYMHSGLVDSIFPRLMSVETAQMAWKILKDKFKVVTRVKGNNVVSLKRQFEMLKMAKDETVHQYSTKLTNLVNEIRTNGGDFPDKRIVEKIMVSVVDKFESKISTIKETCDWDTLIVS